MSRSPRPAARVSFVKRNEGESVVLEMHGEMIFRAYEYLKPLIAEIERCEAETIFMDLKHLARTDVTTLGMLLMVREAADATERNLVILNAPRDISKIASLSETGRSLQLEMAA